MNGLKNLVQRNNINNQYNFLNWISACIFAFQSWATKSWCGPITWPTRPLEWWWGLVGSSWILSCGKLVLTSAWSLSLVLVMDQDFLAQSKSGEEPPLSSSVSGEDAGQSKGLCVLGWNHGRPRECQRQLLVLQQKCSVPGNVLTDEVRILSISTQYSFTNYPTDPNYSPP